MRYRNDKLIDRLAAEYVVGTLRGGARARFERLRAREPAIAAQVRDWEDRLYGLTSGVPTFAPSPKVWPQIALRVGIGGEIAAQAASGARRKRPAAWLALAAGVAVLAIVVVTARYVERSAVGAWQTVAQVNTSSGQALWILEFDAQANSLRARAVGPSGAPDAKSLELWALPPGTGGTPVSLGLLPRTGTTSLPLTGAQVSALRLAQQVAVSLEPRGGSPTGLPTGPVLHVARVDLAHRS